MTVGEVLVESETSDLTRIGSCMVMYIAFQLTSMCTPDGSGVLILAPEVACPRTCIKSTIAFENLFKKPQAHALGRFLR